MLLLLVITNQKGANCPFPQKKELSIGVKMNKIDESKRVNSKAHLELLLL
jgi:hypothetical protein